MPHEVQGVVARARNAPVSLEAILVPDPGPGEALVRVEACGVCRTDLHYRDGGISEDFPFLLGHEAAGEVVAVGPDVRALEPGAFVILNWRAVCGACRSCRRGRPQYCFSTFNATQKMRLVDGTPLTAALGIGAFAELTLVAAGQCTEVPRVRPEVAGLLGCGGVGSAAIAGARLVGATTIVAVDVDDRKLESARAFGATHVVNSTREDPVSAVRAATRSYGVDVAIEAVGQPEVLEQAFFARDLAGTVVQVGVPTPEMRLPDLPMIEFFGRGGSLRPSWYGDCLPERDFPLLIELYRQGRLDLDRFVSEVIGIDDVEAAFSKMTRGDVLRSVVVMRA